MDIFLSIISVFLIITLVPLPVYTIFTTFFGLKEPEQAGKLSLGVVVEKAGIALGFVLLFSFASNFTDWVVYSSIWVLMYGLVELGQIWKRKDYPHKGALAGIISETIYFPLSGWIISLILG